MASKKTREELNDSNDELSSMIDDVLNNSSNEIKDPELPALTSIIAPHDYTEGKKKSLNKARKLLFSLLDFYLTEEFINENQYILHKSHLDEMGLSQIINQISLNERAIDTMLKTIDTGELHPRMFEVFSTLQRTHIELLKLQSMYMTNMEETIKKIKNDYDFYRGQKEQKQVFNKIDDVNNEGIYKGTKELMKELSDDDDFNFDEIIELNDEQ